MSNIDLDRIFFPSQHIQDPTFFAGRKDDIEKAVQSLCSDGASMLVYGERGAGKTSFVEMIKQLAEGNSHLLYKYHFHKRYPPEKFKFKVISTVCDEETNTSTKVLQSLVTSPKGIKGLLSTRMEKLESTIKNGYTLNFLKLVTISQEEEVRKSTSEFNEQSIFEKFSNLILTISNEVLGPGEGLLIVIDEFDLIQDGPKMAGLIKKLSVGNVKFLLCGIAESHEQLFQGHQSIPRQLFLGRIHIHLMSDDEIKEVFEIATTNTKSAVRFEKEFIEEVIAKSGRFPYFVQLYGKLSLDAYYREMGYHTPMIIHNQHLRAGLRRIALYEERWEQEYLTIINENPLKEFIVKFLSRQAANKIHEDEILTYCHKKNIMHPQPKNTLASLLAQRDPQFLLREKEDSPYVFFVDKLFKTFVTSREPELIRFSNGEYSMPRKSSQKKV